MTRTVDDAIQSINEQLRAQSEDLCLVDPAELQRSVVVADDPRVMQTTHDLSESKFEIVHLLVEVRAD